MPSEKKMTKGPECVRDPECCLEQMIWRPEGGKTEKHSHSGSQLCPYPSWRCVSSQSGCSISSEQSSPQEWLQEVILDNIWGNL